MWQYLVKWLQLHAFTVMVEFSLWLWIGHIFKLRFVVNVTLLKMNNDRIRHGHKPVRGIDSQWSRLDVPPHDDTTRRAVDVRHFHPSRARVHPVDVVRHPVDHHALWWLQVGVHHVLRHASVHERTADALKALSHAYRFSAAQFVHTIMAEAVIRAQLDIIITIIIITWHITQNKDDHHESAFLFRRL